MSPLVGGPVRLTTPGVPPLAGRPPGTHSPRPRELLASGRVHVAGLHLQAPGKGRGLSGAEDVVGGGEPNVNNLKGRIVPPRVDDLVDGRVPVEGLVLLDVARVACRVPQVLERDLGAHRAGGDCSVKPVDVVAEALSDLRFLYYTIMICR